jgi:hypothetical protein
MEGGHLIKVTASGKGNNRAVYEEWVKVNGPIPSRHYLRRVSSCPFVECVAPQHRMLVPYREREGEASAEEREFRAWIRRENLKLDRAEGTSPEDEAFKKELKQEEKREGEKLKRDLYS